jgi:glycine dehydrogenase subunit 1
LRELAKLNLNKTEYAKKVVSQIKSCKVAFSSPTFNEFVLEINKDPEKVLEKIKEEGILGGLPMRNFYPELDHHLLVTVTEMNTRQEIDRWGEVLEKAMK